MPVSPTYPGVYVQEVPSGVRTIVGAPTSVGLFIGAANGGPVGRPIQCFNYSDFIRNFGEASRTTNLGRYLRLFFFNGGTTCYVMRIAFNASSSEVTLYNEAGNGSPANIAFTLRAKQQGKLGNQIRAEVSYATALPETTFNIELFEWDPMPTGPRQRKNIESFRNLTMDPSSPSYAIDFITQTSKLVDAVRATAPTAATGFSQSGRILAHANTGAGLQAALDPLLGGTRPTNQINISVGGSAPVNVDFAGITIPTGADVAAGRTAVELLLQNRITSLMSAAGVTDTVTIALVNGPAVNTTTVFQFSSVGKDVIIMPGDARDLAGPMMLGVEQGGFEVGAFAGSRPAPNGAVLRSTLDAAAAPVIPGSDSLFPFADAQQDSIANLTLTLASATDLLDFFDTLETRGPANLMREDNYSGSITGRSDGVREKLDIIVDHFNAFAASDPEVGWRAERWGNYRLAFIRTTVAGDDENLVPGLATTPTYDIGPDILKNVRYYALGTTGAGGFQALGVAGSDGTAPTPNDYTAAFDIADKEIDLFNLMVLPPDATVALHDSIYGEASLFCMKRRAFLIMDPPASWNGVQQKAAINAIRVGVEKQYAAMYYPRVKMKENGREITLGPSAAIAGLFGRMDGTRGVWKAAAGTEATLRAVSGLEYLFTDDENGAMNPRGLNILRAFPQGIVSWGARTLDGDDEFGSEYKYSSIRRLASFIEETLYRNLKWVVFEPNDEPLWAQIRLNVGAFMQDLFRKGAFEGATPKTAYFVRCDGETTTATDRALGIVNIWVGFAPLKPAEFVILYLQQMAAQAEV